MQSWLLHLGPPSDPCPPEKQRARTLDAQQRDRQAPPENTRAVPKRAQLSVCLSGRKLCRFSAETRNRIAVIKPAYYSETEAVAATLSSCYRLRFTGANPLARHDYVTRRYPERKPRPTHVGPVVALLVTVAIVSAHAGLPFPPHAPQAKPALGSGFHAGLGAGLALTLYPHPTWAGQ